MRSLQLFLTVLCISWVSTVCGAEIKGITITDFGTAKSVGEHRADALSGSNTIAGDPEIKERTDRIPAQLGTRFGVRYVVTGTPADQEVRITLKWVHPGIKDPKDKAAVYSQEVMTNRRIGTSYFSGYSLDKQYELVPGVWTLELYYESTKLAEKAFTLYKP